MKNKNVFCLFHNVTLVGLPLWQMGIYGRIIERRNIKDDINLEMEFRDNRTKLSKNPFLNLGIKGFRTSKF